MKFSKRATLSLLAACTVLGAASVASAADAPLKMAWVYVGFGLLLCFVDVLRIGRWLVARTRGV